MRLLRRVSFQVFLWIKFIFIIVYEIIVANCRVARTVLTPGLSATPALMFFPLSCETDLQITIFANIISLTPGTLTLEISEDRQYLLLHVMFFTDKKKQIYDLKRKFERPLMEIL